MNAEWSRVVRSWDERGSVGEWTEWAQWTPPEKLPRWFRTREVEMFEHVEVERTEQTCKKKCPPGFRPLGNPVSACEWWDLHDPDHHAIPHHSISTSTRRETHTDRWIRLEWQWTTSDPHLHWRNLIQVILALLGSDRAETASGYDTPPENAPDEEIVELFPLPALCEGDGVILGDGDVEYSVSVNGREHKADQVLDSAELGVGFHLIELVGWERELGSVRLQMPMSVFSPVEIRVPPVTEVEITEHVNGGIVQVELRNRSLSDQRVRVELQSMPPGWMALCLGEPTHIIKPGEAVQIEVQVEEMVPQTNEYDLLPFTLRACLPGAPAADVFSTFHVSATVPDRPEAFWGAPPALQTP